MEIIAIALLIIVVISTAVGSTWLWYKHPGWALLTFAGVIITALTGLLGWLSALLLSLAVIMFFTGILAIFLRVAHNVQELHEHDGVWHEHEYEGRRKHYHPNDQSDSFTYIEE